MGTRQFAALALLTILTSWFTPDAFATLAVTAPPAGSTTVPAGNDYATQVVGDAWDMNNTQDVDLDESVGLSSEAFSSGIYSAINNAGGCNAGFYPLFMGYGTNTVATARGQMFPINPGIYRYLTMKVKATGGAAMQQNFFFFFQDGNRAAGTYGASAAKFMSPNQWNIQTWDLTTEVSLSSPYVAWTGLPHVEGIEVIPCSAGSPNLQFDWIRLTAAPSAAQTYTVAWTDTGSSSSYTITAIDGDGARYPFNATPVSGNSYSADFSRLAPGDYYVEVRRADNTTALSSGVVHVNFPPQVNISAPSKRGEQALSYAVTQQGGQWAVPMKSADFKNLVDFTNVTYSNPAYPGSFSGRPTNNDPEFIMNTVGHPIDSSYYRSLCFTQEVFGTRSIGNGSIARVFWGLTSSSVSTTTDIILGNGLVEYCLPDLADAAAVPLVPGSPQPWSGNLAYFRMDPDELPPPNGCSTPQTCYDVRLDSIVLAPFAHAGPTYAIQLTVTDPDYTAGGSIQVYLDPDTAFGNGNEILVGSMPYTAGTYNLVADQRIPNGTYHLVLYADDGHNAVAQYAGGPIVTNNSDVIFRDGFDAP